MSKRISYSLLDPWLGPPLKSLYKILPIPRRFPPEGIVLIGHLLAILAAVGFAYSTRCWWGGLLAGLGVLGNHTADCLDGTHARVTGQCRNGGELLDHFTDPLSFAYWLVGISVSCSRLDLGLAAVICLYATAVLTNIKAKIIGEFALARFGPTEFKTLLILYGMFMTALVSSASPSVTPENWAQGFFVILILCGVLQLLVALWVSVQEVNKHATPPDTTEWITKRDN
ncbi:MAG: CDP-alcohol phosphatidyltransferase family protein [Fuerstiella sp.]|nr:CDP-alcohol phosphatidyltransferase family protein [Fuerstiella sp.]